MGVEIVETEPSCFNASSELVFCYQQLQIMAVIYLAESTSSFLAAFSLGPLFNYFASLFTSTALKGEEGLPILTPNVPVPLLGHHERCHK